MKMQTPRKNGDDSGLILGQTMPVQQAFPWAPFLDLRHHQMNAEDICFVAFSFFATQCYLPLHARFTAPNPSRNLPAMFEKPRDLQKPILLLMEKIRRSPVDMVDITLFTRVSYMSGGAGFLPSTIEKQFCVGCFPSTVAKQFWAPEPCFCFVSTSLSFLRRSVSCEAVTCLFPFPCGSYPPGIPLRRLGNR